MYLLNNLQYCIVVDVTNRLKIVSHDPQRYLSTHSTFSSAAVLTV
jgi:hypothetical protein